MTARSLSEEDDLEVAIRYKLGQSTLALAARFGVHEASIRRALDRVGVPRRSRQGT